MDFSQILKFRKDLTIKKHVEGKILLGFPPSLAFNPEVIKILKDNSEKPASIYKTHLNIFARTVSLEYDAQAISKDLLEEVITAKTEEEATKTLKLLLEQVHGT